MTLNDYQIEAVKTNKYPKITMLYDLVLGLCSEAGEVADKLKKFDRDCRQDNTALSEDKVKLVQDLYKELGDVLWYTTNIAQELGLSMDDVARGNVMKLADRERRNKIGGSGDDR